MQPIPRSKVRDSSRGKISEVLDNWKTDWTDCSLLLYDREEARRRKYNKYIVDRFCIVCRSTRGLSRSEELHDT